MLKINSSILVFFISLQVVFCQKVLHKDYGWEENTTVTSLSPKDTAEFELVLFEKRSIEFAPDEEGNMREFYFFHQRLRLNSGEAIERNNKFYLPVSEGVEVISLKGRSISPEGKVKSIGTESIIEAEEDGTKVKYFAFEGIEKGSEIEYSFLLNRNPRLTGNIFYLQNKFKKLNIEFEIIHPEHLIFKSKSLNGFNELKKDSIERDEIVVLRSVMNNVAPLEDEKYANYDPHRMGLIYKLYGNRSNANYNIVNFDSVAESIYSSSYSDYSKNKSTLAKFTKLMGILPADSSQDKIMKIEKYIKSNYIIFPFDIVFHKKLKTALKGTIGSEKDILKIFVQLLRYHGIDHQIVVTCNRYERRFDPDFEAYNFLQQYLLYFPDTKMYIAPTDLSSRMQYIDYGCYDNYGMFVIPGKVGKLETGTAKIKYIPSIAENNTTDSLFLNCNFNAEFDKLNIDYMRSVRGYYAKPYQTVWHRLDDETKTTIRNEFPNFLTDDKDEIKEVSVENVEENDFPLKPFRVSSKLECEKYIEEVGDKYIFRIGELIGPQAELYLDKERTMEIENPYNHSYHRTIIFTVPDGYKVEGLEKLNISVEKEMDGKKMIGFVSSYKKSGNQIIVTCDEFYRKAIMPATEFELFRDVINSAADFNKITLFVEKEL